MKQYLSPIELGLSVLLERGKYTKVGEIYRPGIVTYPLIESGETIIEDSHPNLDWLPVRRVEYHSGDVRVVHDIEVESEARVIDHVNPEQLEGLLQRHSDDGRVRERVMIFKKVTPWQWSKKKSHWFAPGHWISFDGADRNAPYDINELVETIIYDINNA